MINARSLCNKLDEFPLSLSDRNIDVCCVTETWLSNSIPDCFVCLKDYVVYRHDRCSVGGGVAVFVKNVICSVAVDIPAEYRHVEVVCVDLSFFTARSMLALQALY